VIVAASAPPIDETKAAEKAEKAETEAKAEPDKSEEPKS
jgi:hypothetical protein